MKRRPEEEGQGTFPAHAHSKSSDDGARFDLARELFARTATQVGVLTFNPEGGTWLELLCTSAELEDDDRGKLVAGSRNLAARCIEAAEAFLAVVGAGSPVGTKSPARTYVCPHCKSDDVALCFPCWVSANDIDRRSSWDLDIEAQPEKDSDRGWCPQCGTSVLVERREVR